MERSNQTIWNSRKEPTEFLGFLLSQRSQDHQPPRSRWRSKTNSFLRETTEIWFHNPNYNREKLASARKGRHSKCFLSISQYILKHWVYTGRGKVSRTQFQCVCGLPPTNKQFSNATTYLEITSGSIGKGLSHQNTLHIRSQLLLMLLTNFLQQQPHSWVQLIS